MLQLSRKRYQMPVTKAVLLDVALAVTSMASACVQPFAIPIDNVDLVNGTFMRGLAVTVGTPGQTLAMMASVEANNTYIYDTNGQCSGNTPSWCSTYRGGLFNPILSSTYDEAANINSSGADPFDTWVNATVLQEDIWSTDTFNFTSNASSTAPFGIMRANTAGDYHTQHALGLGPNSTMLNALKSSRKIASRSWSMYWGNSGVTEARPGTFVFGGFDQRRVSGSNMTAPLTYSDECGTGMIVTIENLQLTYPNGTPSSLFEGSTSSAALSACIVPDFPVMMTLPRVPYYNSLESTAGITDIDSDTDIDTHSFGISFFGNTYPSSQSIDFGMAITFSSGLVIQIANSQLVQPDESIISNGTIISNSTVNELNIIALQSTSADDFIKLGRQFLSGAYLLVNYDSGTFTMWQADTDDTEEEDLAGVDEKGTIMHPSTCAATNPASNTTSISTPSPVIPATLSTGAIAGIAIGGVVCLVLVGLGAFFLLRKRRNGAVAEVSPIHTSQEEKPPTPPYGSHPRRLQEMNTLQELPSSDKAESWKGSQEIESESHLNSLPRRQTLPGMHELESR